MSDEIRHHQDTVDDAVEQQEVEAEVASTPSGELDPAELGLVLPDDHDQAVQLLLGELRDARAEANSYLDDLKRVAADFDNFRKRAQRERTEIIERASERVLKALLPVLDSFDAALAIEPQTATERKLLDGMRNTYNLLLDVLRKEGLEIIPTWQEPFNPEIHEAVMSPEGGGELVVSQELRRGYTLGGKVVRAALVALESSDRTGDQTGDNGSEA